MAERALELLEQRSAAAGRRPVRVCVPTAIRLHGAKEDSR